MTLLRKLAGHPKWVPVLCFLPFIGVALYDVLCKRRYLLDIIAWEGFSPIAYVYKRAHPALFAHDFPSGIELYDTSLFMQVYRFAYEALGIEPEKTIFVVITFELLLVAFAVVFVTFSLIENRRKAWLVAFVMYCLYCCSYGRLSFASFGTPFFRGQFYNVCDALRLFSIGLFLRKRYVAAIVAGVGAVFIHPVMGLIGCAFVAGMFLVQARESINRRTVLTLSAGMLAVGVWIFVSLPAPSETVSGEIFVRLTKMNNFHWFPITMGYFGKHYSYVLLPFLSLALLCALLRSLANRPMDERHRSIIVGMFVMLLLTILGIALSELTLSPTLIKLSLHRASILLTFFLLTFTCSALYDTLAEFKTVDTLIASGAIAVLSTTFERIDGLPIFVTLGLWGLALVCKKSVRRTTSVITVAGVVGFLACLFYLIRFQGWLLPWRSLLASFYPVLSTRWGMVFVVLLGVYLLRRFSQRDFLPLALGSFALWGVVTWQTGTFPADETIAKARDFRDAQVWARQHTPEDALFMPDPTIYYGWRDYAHRSSFGNSREWTMTSWMYTGDQKVYEQGMQRFAAMGLNIEEFLDEDIGLEGFYRTIPALKQRYYDFSDHWHAQMAERFALDYFVFIKPEAPAGIPFAKVFENDTVAIVASSDLSKSSGSAR
ncbi:MAG: hypothetical protein R3C68_16690 [Myxococcota bacterium]